MVLHRPDQLTSLRHLPSWALLALAAGAVNAGAFLACQRFVSHVTGTLTNIGVDAGQLLALDYLLVAVAFIAGATSAIVVVRRSQDSKVSKSAVANGIPPYWVPLSVVSVVLVAVAISGHFGAFGTFGGSVETAHDFALLAILSFVMGMQNAAVAASTAMAVRTTHMSGPATDLAIGLGTLIAGERKEHQAARQSILLRATKIIAFVAGAALMAVFAPRLHYLAFLLPAAAGAIATFSSFAPSRVRAEEPHTST